jgi:hypothetical protein
VLRQKPGVVIETAYAQKHALPSGCPKQLKQKTVIGDRNSLHTEGRAPPGD